MNPQLKALGVWALWLAVLTVVIWISTLVADSIGIFALAAVVGGGLLLWHFIEGGEWSLWLLFIVNALLVLAAIAGLLHGAWLALALGYAAALAVSHFLRRIITRN